MNHTFLIFGALFLLFVLQIIGCKMQITHYKKAVSKIHKLGNVGIGQKRGGIAFGHLVLVACGNDGIIRRVETMEGMTILARFKHKKEILGRTPEGVHIMDMLEDFKSLDKKKQKRFKGYIQALEALEMRLYPEHV